MPPHAVPARSSLGLSMGTDAAVDLLQAFACNLAAAPLAAFGLQSLVIAGAAVAASSILAVTNSPRLRRFAPHAQGKEPRCCSTRSRKQR